MGGTTGRTTAATLALSLALGVAVLLCACVAPANPGPAPAATGAPSQGPGTNSSVAPADSGPQPSAATPSAGWLTFTTKDGLSFDFPDGWSVTDAAGEMPLSGVFVDVVNAAGKPMASLRTNLVTGAECVDKLPFEVYDSEPMQALAEPGGGDGEGPRYVFESRGDDTAPGPTRTTIAAYGITLVPEEAEATACPMFHLFLWAPSGAFFGGTYNPDNNRTPGDASLPYLAKAKLYAGTPEYQDIRKMITSLRPAAAPGK
jgi:hypothetical protein